MPFEKIPREIIDDGIRYNTLTGKLLAYTEHTQNNFESGPFDKLIYQGKNGRCFLAIQKPNSYKNGDGSVRITPLSKNEAIEIYNDLAVKEISEIESFESAIKA